MFNAGFNPFFNTQISTQRGHGAFGGFNNFQMNQSLNAMGKGFLFGKLGMGIANIFLNKNNANPVQNFYTGINSGIYGMLNNNGPMGNPATKAIDHKANLQTIYGDYKILDNKDGTFSITKGDGTIEKTGTYEELLKAAEKKTTPQGNNVSEKPADKVEEKPADKVEEKPEPQGDKVAEQHEYVVANGESIDKIAKKVLKAQGKTNPTSEEIAAAKAQIIKDNPDAVKGKQGREYFLVGAKINVQADIGTNDAQTEINKYNSAMPARRTSQSAQSEVPTDLTRYNNGEAITYKEYTIQRKNGSTAIVSDRNGRTTEISGHGGGYNAALQTINNGTVTDLLARSIPQQNSPFGNQSLLGNTPSGIQRDESQFKSGNIFSNGKLYTITRNSDGSATISDLMGNSKTFQNANMITNSYLIANMPGNSTPSYPGQTFLNPS